MALDTAVNLIGRATLPNGTVKRFIHLTNFDAYVRTWREAGFSLRWHDPRTVLIYLDKAP